MLVILWYLVATCKYHMMFYVNHELPPDDMLMCCAGGLRIVSRRFLDGYDRSVQTSRGVAFQVHGAILPTELVKGFRYAVSEFRVKQAFDFP